MGGGPIQESTTGALFLEEVRYIFLEDNLLHVISKLHHVMCSFMLVLKFFVYSAHSENHYGKSLNFQA